MRALVTGGAGLIGSHIVDRLIADGWEVRILDTLSKPVHLYGMPDYLNESAEFVLGDVKDASDLAGALKDTDVVFHQAAYQGFLPDYSKFWATNSASTAMIYEIAKEQHLNIEKVVIASSQAVYGEGLFECDEHGKQYPEPRSDAALQVHDWEQHCKTCSLPLKPLATPEDHVAPTTMYAQSKYSQESIGFALGQSLDIPTVALRYSIVQGPRHSVYNSYSGICRIFTSRVAAGEVPVVYEDGAQLRDYTSVDDIVSANMTVLGTDRANFQAFNVGSGHQTNILEYLSHIESALGKSTGSEIPGRYRVGDVRHIFSDTTKLQELGWSPTKSVGEIIQSYVDWLRGQGPIEEYFADAERTMRELDVVRTAQS
jgi:dTDP-L-rhamnose 4-epimerase